MRARRRAFTLVETIVTIGVIGVLLSIAASAYANARGAGRRAVCLSNLRTLGMATDLYRMDHDGLLPLALRPMIPAYGWIAPLDQLAPYLSTPIPRFVLEQRGCETGAPFVCPADPADPAEVGVSYMYVPFVDMVTLGQRGVKAFYAEEPRQAIFMDNSTGFHRRVLPTEHRGWRGSNAVNERGELGWIEEVWSAL